MRSRTSSSQRRKQRKKATTARKVAEAAATAADDDDHQLPPPPVRRREEEPSSLEQILEEDEELEALEEEAAVVELPKSRRVTASPPTCPSPTTSRSTLMLSGTLKESVPLSHKVRRLAPCLTKHARKPCAPPASPIPSSSCNAMTHRLGTAAQAAAPDSDPSGTWLKPRAARRRGGAALAARRRHRVSSKAAAR